jgi:glucose-1-phosphate thymidylyltransferase
MKVYVFEDSTVSTLGPLVMARPACDVTIGTETLHEMLTRFGQVHRIVRPHLQRYLLDLDTVRAPFWGSNKAYDQCCTTNDEHVLFINARLIPNRAHLVAIQKLLDAGHCCKIYDGNVIAAAVINQNDCATFIDAASSEDELLPQLLNENSDPIFDGELTLIDSPEDFLTAHEQSIEGMTALAIDSGRYIELRSGLYQEKKQGTKHTSTIDDFITIRSGPVLIEDDVNIGPFCCFDGPVKVGSRSKIHPHSWLGPATVVGRDCRLAGEVTATVMESFSNKSHDGFLGHSHLGSWVNLGAGTVTANLKVSYGMIKIYPPDNNVIKTKRQFFGMLCGDFTKTAVRTALPCGALIGPASTLGGNPPATVRPFTTDLGGKHPVTTATVDQLTTALERMMHRRGIHFHSADRNLLISMSTEENKNIKIYIRA